MKMRGLDDDAFQMWVKFPDISRTDFLFVHGFPSEKGVLGSINSGVTREYAALVVSISDNLEDKLVILDDALSIGMALPGCN